MRSFQAILIFFIVSVQQSHQDLVTNSKGYNRNTYHLTYQEIEQLAREIFNQIHYGNAGQPLPMYGDQQKQQQQTHSLQSGSVNDYKLQYSDHLQENDKKIISSSIFWRRPKRQFRSEQPNPARQNPFVPNLPSHTPVSFNDLVPMNFQKIRQRVRQLVETGQLGKGQEEFVLEILKNQARVAHSNSDINNKWTHQSSKQSHSNEIPRTSSVFSRPNV